MKTKARFSPSTESGKNRGQSAVEYLLNYGWVLLAVGVGMIMIWQSFDFTPKYTERRIVGFSELKVEDFSFSRSDNKLKIYVRNEAPSRDGIQVTALSADLNMQGMQCNSSQTVDISASAGQLISLDCPQFSQKYRTGEYAKAILAITYYNLNSQNTHNSTGVLVGYAE